MKIEDQNIIEINGYDRSQTLAYISRIESGFYDISAIRHICGDDFEEVCEMLGIEY